MASVLLLTISTPLSKVSLTPVKTSNDSLPALFTSSNAPAKSPLKTFFTALAKNPRVSKKLSKRSTMFAFILAPNSLTLSNGSSKYSFKKVCYFRTII